MSPELSQALHSGEIINEISRVENGYLIVTNYNVLFVEVKYIKTDKIGPFRFKLYFHDPMPLIQKSDSD